MNKVELANKIKNLEGLTNEDKSSLLKLLHEQKRFGLVWEEKDEETQNILREFIPVLKEVPERRIVSEDKDAPNHVLIEGDNLHAITALTYSHEGQFDAIYIDPPYNSGARDWKYNNDYVDGLDAYRHSKWLSMIQHRIAIAKKLLNPYNSILIVTIDEKEFLHLGCLLEDMFPNTRIQMVSSVINTAGATRESQFARTDEYLFFVFIGECKPHPVLLDKEWLIGKNSNQGKITWDSLKRAGGHNKRTHSPGCFYPIFVAKDGSRIISVGDVLPIDIPKESIIAPDGCKAIWPMQNDNIEGCWQTSPDKLRVLIDKGFVKLGRFTSDNTMAISYLKRGEQQKVESGFYQITGRRSDNSIIVNDDIQDAPFLPGTQWNIPSHNAKQHGTMLLSSIIGKDKFPFPKSLAAVHDALRFFVDDNPKAKILDFFAGSGTTLHATMNLNEEDGGHRQCILVTNNENNICEEVTYERNKRVIQGYTTPKGVEVEGLKKNNLRYYKTEFVPRENTSANRRALMSASVDLLCIKENIYTEQETFGGRKFKKSVLRYFEEGEKQMLVVLDERVISLIIPMIADIAKKESPMKVFVFSDGQYAYEDEFHEVMPLIDLCALPDAIYQALNKVLPERQYSEEMIAEFNQEDAEEALQDTYNYKSEEGGVQ